MLQNEDYLKVDFHGNGNAGEGNGNDFHLVVVSLTGIVTDLNNLLVISDTIFPSFSRVSCNRKV